MRIEAWKINNQRNKIMSCVSLVFFFEIEKKSEQNIKSEKQKNNSDPIRIYPKKFSKTNFFYGSFLPPIYSCPSSWTCIPSCCDGFSFPLYWKRRDSLILIRVKLLHGSFELNNLKKNFFFRRIFSNSYHIVSHLILSFLEYYDLLIIK